MKIRVFAWPVAACLFAGSAMAQFNSSIQGTVTDKSGAVVPDARIRVTHTTTGVVRDVTTSEDGVYRALSLSPGTYLLAVEKAGFLSSRRENVNVGINEAIKADFILDVEGISERVTVTAEAALVETEQGRVSGRIDQAQLKELPLNTRNVFNLLALQPGVAGRGLSQGYGAGSPGDSFAGESGPDVYASGGRREANNYTVDDTSVNGMARSGITNLTPSPEAVEEIRVVSNNFSAVDGRSSGAQIQVITKGGSNQFHAGVSYYFQNNTLSSRSVFDPSVPVYRRHLFGYTVGGPIVKNRTFFFTSYDGLRQSGGASDVAVVETPELRDYVLRTRPNSIAAKIFRDFKPIADPSFNIRDAGSPAVGVGVIGAADGIPDMGSARYLPHRERNGNQFNVRIDHELRPGKDRLYGNFFRTFNTSVNGTIRPTFDLPVEEHTTYGNLNYTHIFTPTVVNELRAGVMRLRGLPPPAQRLDIPGLVVPSMSIRPQYSYPRGWAQTNYQYKDILSWIHGSHSIKTGAEVRRMYGWAQNTSNFIPRYDFANILDFVDDEPRQMARLVDPRTGEPATVASELRVTEWALFVADDWKVRRNFNVNIGLRYENFGSLTDKENTLRNIVFGGGNGFAERLANAKVDIVPRFYNTDKLNFAPRLGFAWDIGGKGKTSVRGGYGISYDRLMNLPAENYRTSPPMRATANLGQVFGTQFTYSLGDASKPGFGYPVDPALRLGLDERNGIRGTRVGIAAAVDPNLVSPYVHNWFLGIQREVWRGVVMEVNYLGSAGHHLHNAVNVNRYTGDLLDGIQNGFNPSFANIDFVQSTSNSIYHGGTVQVRRAFNRGFTLQGAFSYGKSIDDTDTAVGVTTWQDAANRRNERSLSGYDVPRKLSLTGVWELPFFRQKGTFANRLMGGWQLSGLGIFEKGRPFTVTTTAVWPTGDYNGDGTGGDRPNAPPAGVQLGGWNKDQFLLGVFRVTDFPTPTRGTNGNLGRNTFRGPGFAQVDLSLAKTFAATERLHVQVRADAFNAFNRVNLNDPINDLSNTSFGRSIATSTPRLFQLGLRVNF